MGFYIITIRRYIKLLPIIGIAIFLVLTGLAIQQFPGGHRLDKTTIGYSFAHNSWCDLFERISFNGMINHGRGLAIWANIIFMLSLVPFWIYLPLLFKKSSFKVKNLIKNFGVFSMLGTTLMPTVLHDILLLVVVPFGLMAFFLSLLCHYQNKYFSLFIFGFLPWSATFISFAMWYFTVSLYLIAVIQKFALITFMIWVIGSSFKLFQEEFYS